MEAHHGLLVAADCSGFAGMINETFGPGDAQLVGARWPMPMKHWCRWAIYWRLLQAIDP